MNNFREILHIAHAINKSIVDYQPYTYGARTRNTIRHFTNFTQVHVFIQDFIKR